MAYNPTRPADTDLVKKSAELIRDNFESLRKDGIVLAKPPLYGTGTPKASTGENGDRYIDTVTGNHYYKNTTGQWEQTLALDDKYKTIKEVAVLQALISTMEKNLQQVTRSFESYSPYIIGEYKLLAHNDVQASSGFVKSNGGLYNIAKYPNAYAVFGKKHGGDGINTFAVPDWRADAIRINDDGRNIDSGRVLGSEQSDAIRNITGTFIMRGGSGNYPSHILGYSGAISNTKESQASWGSWYGISNQKADIITFNAANSVPTAPENRMRNRSCCMYIYIGRPGIDA